jgi:endonuclease G
MLWGPVRISAVAGSLACQPARRSGVASLLVWLSAVAAQGCAAPRLDPGVGARADTAFSSVHLALGEPTDGDPSDDVLVDHRVFVLSYNPARRVANWVAWRLVAEDLGGAPRRERFHADVLLPAGMPGPRARDYAGGPLYDRGHLCPAGDRTSNAAASAETFVMTNVQPQLHTLNVGPWERLEEFERSLARPGLQVLIVAGGLFDAPPETLPSGVAIPRANFKIIVVLRREETAADVTWSTTTYAVIMPNRATVAGVSWTHYLVAIDQIERETGYDFLSRVSTDTQALLEATPAEAPLHTASN